MNSHVNAIFEPLLDGWASQWAATITYSVLFLTSSGAGLAYSSTIQNTEDVSDGVFHVDIIAITAISTAAVTLILGLANALSAYRSTIERTKLEAEERRFSRAMEIRTKALEARVTLAKIGIKCSIPDCPVVAEITLPASEADAVLRESENPLIVNPVCGPQ
jgi:hypothetical protein